jgi:hypothetical protein
MIDSVKKYVGVLIDRICELSIENRVLREMLQHPETVPRGKWEQVLDLAMRSPKSHSMRQEFASRRDTVLAILEQDEAVEAMLKLAKHLLRQPDYFGLIRGQRHGFGK